MITTNIINRTFHISVNNDFGSCFTMEHQNNQFIITAKHVLDSIEYQTGEEIQVKILHDNQWKNLACKIYIHADPEIDIAVLIADKFEFPKYPINIGLNNLFLGCDIYFLGFPYQLFINDTDGILNHKFPVPFIKKGILSAMLNENDVALFYIDAHNNKGFSGGPVITLGPEKQINIVGVNTSYIRHDNSISIEEQDDDGYLFQKQFEYFENSGIMVANSIHHVIQIIENYR